MKKIAVLILTLIVHLSFAQTEKETNKIVTEKFVQNYNNEDYDAIFLMFAESMQAASPKDKTTEFLEGLQSQAGNITSRAFVTYENGTYASYKTTFERAVLVLNISIDENSKINGMFINPFEEENTTETVMNMLSIKDSIISKKQSDFIFENAKIFPDQTQFSIAFVKNGKVSYYGIKRNSDTISTIDNHKSVFEIGSISKVFTATLLANFVIDGKLKLNDNVNDYLEIPFHKDTKIAFINLANHTSGIPRLPSNLDMANVNLENPYKEYMENELVEYLTTYLELSNIGEYQYSNLGAGLVGYTLSKMENTSYESLLQNNIFSKFNMNHSTSDITKVKGNLVTGLNTEGEETLNWEFSVLAGAGGILSTVTDLSKFMLAQFDSANKELNLTKMKTATVNENMDIGLGWHILKSPSENTWFWHNGGTGGYTSSMVLNETTKNGVIILSNVSAFNSKMGNIDKLCFELMKTLDED